MNETQNRLPVVVQSPPGILASCSRSGIAVVRALRSAGFEAYFAGGCVRDLIMGSAPKDYDICTNATPESVQKLFPESTAVGKAFGVVIVRSGGEDFEVATFRVDHEYDDGRRPVAVSFSDAPSDAMRRDFTVNALFYDPVADTVIDYVGGLADMRAGIVRAVGDPGTRFTEDHLRMLRAVRFEATLGFRLDQPTADAIRANAHQLSRISAERIREEFSRILTESRRAGDAVARLEDLGLLQVFLPEVRAMKGQEQPADLHPEGDVFTHTVKMLNIMKTSDVQLAFAVLLHDIGKPLVASLINGRTRFHFHAERGAEAAKLIMERLRMSNDDGDAICHMIRNHSRMTNVREMKLSTLRKLVGAATFPKELELHRLDRLASTGDTSTCDYLRDVMTRLQNEPVLPAAWISGHDIMALGIPEGRETGQWREKAYDMQLEGRFPDREALLGWLRQEIGSRPGSGTAT